MLIDNLDFSRIAGVLEPLTEYDALSDIEQLYNMMVTDKSIEPFVSDQYRVGEAYINFCGFE